MLAPPPDELCGRMPPPELVDGRCWAALGGLGPPSTPMAPSMDLFMNAALVAASLSDSFGFIVELGGRGAPPA